MVAGGEVAGGAVGAGVVGAGVVGAGVVGAGVVGAGVAGGRVDSPAGADVVAAPASVVDVTAPDPAVVVAELSTGDVLFEAELLHAARASSSDKVAVIRRVMRSFKHAGGGPA